MSGRRWLGVRRQPSPRARWWLALAAFAAPLALWSALSYVPWLWHPQIRVLDPGGSAFLTADLLVERAAFAAENAKLVAAGAAPAVGERANPVFLPAPHAVARALVAAFAAEPVRKGDKRLHESLLHSLRIIAWGFAIAVAIAVPLGILCGAVPALAALIEPVVDVVRYMPPPAFGALAVAVFGINDEPKVAIVVVSTVFSAILVVANSARAVDGALLEAAQTLGARDRALLARVIVPAMLPRLYEDLRILLGSAWTALIVAELIGASSGISWFINQQGKYRNYDNVFAGILIIGCLGLVTDQVLAFVGRFLFPWQGRAAGGWSYAVWRCATWPLRAPVGLVRQRWRTA